MKRRRILFTSVVALGAILIALAAVELGLRVAGFSHQLYPEKIEFGWPEPEIFDSWFVEDSELLWVPHDYAEMLGRSERPRLVFLGDSCTSFGRFDQDLSAMLSRRSDAWDDSYLNLGVPGWSSFSGLAQLRRDVLERQPQIAFIYYGWNDHWIGFGIEDKEVPRVNSAGFRALGRLRIVQLLRRARVASNELRAGEAPLRVSQADYRANLAEMVRLARGSGIVPVLLTAPAAHRRGSEPPYLALRHLRDLDQLVPLHEAYNGIVRDVAAEHEAVLCDVAARMAEDSWERRSGTFFEEDGIHLLEAGSLRVAELMLECLDDNDLTARLFTPR